MSSPYIDENQNIIAVMGTTGVGKSTFINFATGGEAMIGENLESCTSSCKAFQIPHSNVWLIDTPGFDDTHRNDAEILEEINNCLTEYFQSKARVTGVLYIHAITETRMRGSGMKNLRMFREVVGDKNMKNCCLVTTKWSKQSEKTSKSREAELTTNPKFWKTLLDNGAGIRRFQDTMESAVQIIIPLTKYPFVMKLTEEYNVNGVRLDQTHAGKIVFDDLEAVKKEHQQELAALKEEQKRAIAENDEKMQKLIKEEQLRLQEEIADMRKGQELLQKKLSDEKQELVKKMEMAHSIRVREKREMKDRAWRWVARTAAGGVAVSAVVLTAGLATPAAVLFYGGVEAVIQDSK